jgi:hypothetical protein
VIWFRAYYGVNLRAPPSVDNPTNLDPATIPFGWNTPLSPSSVDRASVEKRMDDLLYSYDW